MTGLKQWVGIIAIATLATLTSCTSPAPSQEASSTPDSTASPQEVDTPNLAAEDTNASGAASTTSESDINCSDPALTQQQMNTCAQTAYEEADQALNQVYQQLQANLSPAQQDLLTTAEQAWIEYRDAHCELERSAFEGGSIQPTIYYVCLTRMTEARTAELQNQLQQR